MGTTNTSHKANIVLSALSILFCFHSSLSAQSTEELIQNKTYTFSVRTIQPFRGQLRPEAQVSGYYTVRVTPDSVIAYLPFFGRSFTTTIGSSESPLVFTSTKFDYTITNKKKGGWDIVIKPKDIDKIQEMMLTVFPNGNASMRVISTSRDPMSFEGELVR